MSAIEVSKEGNLPQADGIADIVVAWTVDQVMVCWGSLGYKKRYKLMLAGVLSPSIVRIQYFIRIDGDNYGDLILDPKNKRNQNKSL